MSSQVSTNMCSKQVSVGLGLEQSLFCFFLLGRWTSNLLFSSLVLNTQFMFLTYILFLAFLAIFGFTAIPVFLFFNMWNTCAAMRSPDANITSPDSICVDVRQYGGLACIAHTCFDSQWLNPPETSTGSLQHTQNNNFSHLYKNKWIFFSHQQPRLNHSRAKRKDFHATREYPAGILTWSWSKEDQTAQRGACFQR